MSWEHESDIPERLGRTGLLEKYVSYADHPEGLYEFRGGWFKKKQSWAKLKQEAREFTKQLVREGKTEVPKRSPKLGDVVQLTEEGAARSESNLTGFGRFDRDDPDLKAYTSVRGIVVAKRKKWYVIVWDEVGFDNLVKKHAKGRRESSAWGWLGYLPWEVTRFMLEVVPQERKSMGYYRQRTKESTRKRLTEKQKVHRTDEQRERTRKKKQEWWAANKPKPPPTPKLAPKLQRAVELLAAGHTVKEVARELGVYDSQIRKWMNHPDFEANMKAGGMEYSSKVGWKAKKNPILKQEKMHGERIPGHRTQGVPRPRKMKPNVWYTWSTAKGPGWVDHELWGAWLKDKQGVHWEVRATHRTCLEKEGDDYWEEHWWERVEVSKHTTYSGGLGSQQEKSYPKLYGCFLTTDAILDYVEEEYLFSPDEYLYHATKKNPVTQAGRTYYWNRPGILAVFHRNAEKGEPAFPRQRKASWRPSQSPDSPVLLLHSSEPYWYGEYWGPHTRAGVQRQLSGEKARFQYLLNMPSGSFRLTGDKRPPATGAGGFPLSGPLWQVHLERYHSQHFGQVRGLEVIGSDVFPETLGGGHTPADDTIVAINKAVPWAEEIALAPDEYLYWGTKIEHLTNPRRTRKRRARR